MAIDPPHLNVLVFDCGGPQGFLNRTSQACVAVSCRKAPKDGPRPNPSSRSGGAMCSRSIRRYASWAVATASTLRA